jgi:hypothetical protein
MRINFIQKVYFEYTLFPSLGHNTSSADITTPFDISIQWIKQKTLTKQKY